MNQEKVFFQFSMGNNKLKDIIEMQKTYYKNSYKKYRIALLIIVLLLFIDQLLKSIYRYDLSILNAIIIYFTDVRWLVLDCLIFIFMFKIIEVVWCTKYIISKLKKIISSKKLSLFITFYESHCIITHYSSTQVYEE